MSAVEKQGGEIRPCLIGGFRGKNARSPYVQPIEVPTTGGVVSVDMIRARIVFPTADRGEELAGYASMLPSTEVGGYASYTGALFPGRYRVLSTYAIGDSSIALGIGLVGKSSKVDMAQGFVEFNPNKVAQPECESVFHKWCERLSRFVKRCELMRWDLAYDVPVSRGLLRLEKDRRHYKLEQSSSLTEYLGKRNVPGYVKLYDKAAELKLSDMTIARVELTCDGEWDANAIQDRWPSVYEVRSEFEGLSNTNALLVGLMADKIRAGGSVEPELKTLNRRTRKKVRAALEDLTLMKMPRHEVIQAIKQTEVWVRYLMS